MKEFKKIIKVLLILETALFVVPWLALFPVIENLFPEGFSQFGWLYSMYGVIALAPTLLAYVIVNHFDSKANQKPQQINDAYETGSTNEIDRVLWIIATGLFSFWALSFLFG